MPDHVQNAERRREQFRGFLRDIGRNPADLAREIGKTNANFIYNFLNGRSKSISMDTVERIHNIYPNHNIARMLGIDLMISTDEFTSDGRVPANGIEYSSARQASAADVRTPTADRQDVNLQLEHIFRLPADDPGCARLFPKGTVLECVSLRHFKREIRPGNRLVIRRGKGTRAGRIVRELIVLDGKAWLVSHTDDPELQGPIPAPWPIATQSWRGASGERLAVEAVILSAQIPQI